MSERKKPIIRDGHTFWECPICEKEKLAEEFHKCTANPNGLYSYCKECQNEIVSKRYFKERRKKKTSNGNRAPLPSGL